MPRNLKRYVGRSDLHFITFARYQRRALLVVRYSPEQTIWYSYDSANRILEVEDSSQSLSLVNEYDVTGRVIELETGPGSVYSFRYLVDDMDIRDPRGRVTRVHVTSDRGSLSYTVGSQD